MTREEIITKAFMYNRESWFRYASKQASDLLNMSQVDMEIIVDDVFINTLKTRREFSNWKDASKYMYASLKNNIRFAKRRKFIETMPGLSDEKMMEQMNLARDIINSHRK